MARLPFQELKTASVARRSCSNRLLGEIKTKVLLEGFLEEFNQCLPIFSGIFSIELVAFAFLVLGHRVLEDFVVQVEHGLPEHLDGFR